MKGLLVIFLAVLFIFSFLAVSFAQNKWENLLVESGKVFEEMTKMPDEGIPESLLEKSYAVAIFPSTIGAGFIFGGQYGQGVIIAKDKSSGKWSSPAVFNLVGGSFGLQIGGQATDVILLIMNERGLDGILQSKCKLGADAAVSAGPIGRDAQAAADLTMKSSILSYSRSRGAFIGIKLEGAVISSNHEANAELYGPKVSAKDILINNKVKRSKYDQRLMEGLKKY